MLGGWAWLSNCGSHHSTGCPVLRALCKGRTTASTTVGNRTDKNCADSIAAHPCKSARMRTPWEWCNAKMGHPPKSLLAQHAIDFWLDRKNVPYWQVHTTNLMAASPVGPLRPGTTINFEPIASIDGQGFFLEDMYIITKDGAELLTPGVPYSAEEIEAAMK